MLASAEKLLALTGDAVALCPVYGVDGSAVHPSGVAAQPAGAAGAAS